MRNHEDSSGGGSFGSATRPYGVPGGVARADGRELTGLASC
jgi:hypothetical protein